MEAQTSASTPKPTPGCRQCAHFEQVAKSAIRQRDELDKTLLAMDGGVGHWRRAAKDLSILLNHVREERNKRGRPGEPGRLNDKDMQKLFGERRDEDVQKCAAIIVAAADRETDVEGRIQRARDLLYKLMQEHRADAHIHDPLRQVWQAL
jgi:hypothetical protein